VRYAVVSADAGDFWNQAILWDVVKLPSRHKKNPATAVDLSKCTHLKPYSLACLAAVGASTGGEAQLVLPHDGNCREHVIRAGLHQWFQVTAVPEVHAKQTNVPIRQLTAGPGSFANEAMEIWAKQLQEQLSPGILPKLENHLDEMIYNALGHSESEVGCFVAGQASPSRHIVEVSIVDLGIGVRTHLTRHPAYILRFPGKGGGW